MPHPRRLPRAAGAAVLLAALLFGAGTSPATAATSVSAVTGSAYGYRAFSITLFGGAQPDVGPTPTVALTSDASNSPQSATATTGLVQYGPAILFSADAIAVQGAGSLGTAGSVTTTSSVTHVNKAATQPGTGSEPLTADAVNGSCSASTAGAAGSTSISNGTLQTDSGLDLNNDGNYTDPGEHPPVTVALPANPAPNTSISGVIYLSATSQDTFHFVLNEQATSAGTLTVNPVDEYFDGPILKGRLIIGQVTCGTTVSVVARPPAADSRLYGTWSNTNSTTRFVKQIVLANDGAGGLTVDVFNACTPSLCELGKVPAVMFGTSATSTVGKVFTIDQRQLSGGVEWGRLVLMGQGSFSSTSRKVTLTEYQIFEDGSGRRDYTKTETFVPGTGPAVAATGTTATDYPSGLQPQPVAALIGTWNNISSTAKGIKQLVISTAVGGWLLVHAYGVCSPTPCDNGTVGGVTFGTSTTATTGKVFLAPYTLAVENLLLCAKLTTTSLGYRLKVTELNQFTDGSGRSNYLLNETFAKA